MIKARAANEEPFDSTEVYGRYLTANELVHWNRKINAIVKRRNPLRPRTAHEIWQGVMKRMTVRG